MERRRLSPIPDPGLELRPGHVAGAVAVTAAGLLAAAVGAALVWRQVSRRR